MRLTSRSGTPMLRPGVPRSLPVRAVAQRGRLSFGRGSSSVRIADPGRQALETRDNLEWFRVPPKVYFKAGSLEVALGDLSGNYTRAFIITDKKMFDMDYVARITHYLDLIGIVHATFYHVHSAPSIEAVQQGMRELRSFKPDCIIAVGGGSPMDVGKLMWLQYEHPENNLETSVTATLDMVDMQALEQPMGRKATMVTIPTSIGTGAEVTPFAVLRNSDGDNSIVASHNLTPRMAICDPQLIMELPPKMIAQGGILALSHALESFTSAYSSVYTRGLSRQAISLIFRYLPKAVAEGKLDPVAMEKVMYASCIAGMSFSNSMLGAVHAMANGLSTKFDQSQGEVSGVLLPQVIVYNASKSEQANEDYGEIADMVLQLPKGTDETSLPSAKSKALAQGVKDLVAKVGLSDSLEALLGSSNEKVYAASIHKLTQQALSDLHIRANPRTATPEDIRAMYEAAWTGKL